MLDAGELLRGPLCARALLGVLFVMMLFVMGLFAAGLGGRGSGTAGSPRSRSRVLRKGENAAKQGCS